ncbi:aminoglycoside phosphotransferase family protein [Streptomyces sp. MI02-7b]|uniref:phosphotransferase enzyme family protein n=1 Tax=Streptomyces sp. MI02-7b TaxID=462941 RepID=UPI0029B83400|nr:aminoglycoside phosphotransferase family protein [Streptomyces sp. MI02-7b]MDX3078022.1 aminoglycoside phosphotransferase family protein [Streptomyces sp. MI02-7b]
MTSSAPPLTRALGAVAAAASGIPGPARPPEPAVLAERAESTVVRSGGLVAKAHAGDTDSAALSVRLRVAAHPLLDGILLPPAALPGTDGALSAPVHGRTVTVWPFGQPVDPDAPDAAPWEDAGRLLARLHSVPVAALPGPLPPMRGPAKAARGVARMLAAGAAEPAVLAAWHGLPAWARDEAPQPHDGAGLCHGDLHLGQLVRHPAPLGPWRLIDVDDLGLGRPAWDLARPAMWFAAGLLDPADWGRFLGAYRAAGGPAVPADGDPWPHLDVAARALAVQTAAIAVAKATQEGRVLDGTEQAVLDTCRRIAQVMFSSTPGEDPRPVRARR